MVISWAVLDDQTRQAKNLPRLRMNYTFHEAFMVQG